MSRLLLLPALFAAVAFTLSGCSSDTPPAEPAAQTDAHDHDHDHEHHHEDLGPNGGHLLTLGESGYQAEWIHQDEQEVIAVYVLDADKQPAPVAYSATFETKVGEVTNAYPLEAVNPDNDGLASQFTITSGELLTAVKMAEQSADAAQATLVANLQNGEVRAPIEVHDHDHAH